MDPLAWFLDHEAQIQAKFDLYGPEDVAEAMRAVFRAARAEAVSRKWNRDVNRSIVMQDEDLFWAQDDYWTVEWLYASIDLATGQPSPTYPLPAERIHWIRENTEWWIWSAERRC